MYELYLDKLVDLFAPNKKSPEPLSIKGIGAKLVHVEGATTRARKRRAYFFHTLF